MAIELDTSLWPMPVTTVGVEMPPDDLEIYLARFAKEVIGRGETFVSVVDVTMMEGAPGAAAMQMTAKWLKDHERDGVPLALGYVIAMSSGLVRGAMTAVHWLNPPLVPTKFVANRAQAVRWAVARMEEHQMPVKPAIYRYLESLERIGQPPQRLAP